MTKNMSNYQVHCTCNELNAAFLYVQHKCFYPVTTKTCLDFSTSDAPADMHLHEKSAFIKMLLTYFKSNCFIQNLCFLGEQISYIFAARVNKCLSC